MITEEMERMNAEIETKKTMEESQNDVTILPAASETMMDAFMPGITRCMADFKARTSTDQDMELTYLQIRRALSSGRDVAMWLAVRETDRAIIGYLVAHLADLPGNKKECFIWQAYSAADNIFNLGWTRVHRWACDKGCSSISFMTNRNDEAMARKLDPFGFKKKSTLFEVKLNG